MSIKASNPIERSLVKTLDDAPQRFEDAKDLLRFVVLSGVRFEDIRERKPDEKDITENAIVIRS